MKTALVTGSTSKIGKSIVIALANNGYNIIAHGYSSKNSIYKIQTQVKNIGKSCEIFLVDLCSLKQIREFTQIKC